MTDPYDPYAAGVIMPFGGIPVIESRFVPPRTLYLMRSYDGAVPTLWARDAGRLRVEMIKWDLRRYIDDRIAEIRKRWGLPEKIKIVTDPSLRVEMKVARP